VRGGWRALGQATITRDPSGSYSLDDRHVGDGVEKHCGVIGAQPLGYAVQFGLAVGGPHQVRDAECIHTARTQLAFFMQVDEQAFSRRQQRHVGIANESTASEHVTVELQRAVEVSHANHA
jgi:hypothetical protein